MKNKDGTKYRCKLNGKPLSYGPYDSAVDAAKMFGTKTQRDTLSINLQVSSNSLFSPILCQISLGVSNTKWGGSTREVGGKARATSRKP